MSKIDKELIDPIVEPDSEKAHRVTRAAIAAIPVLGGTLVETFNALIEPPMAKRKTEWMVEVTQAINELYEKGIVTEKDLQENEKFFGILHFTIYTLCNYKSDKAIKSNPFSCINESEKLSIHFTFTICIHVINQHSRFPIST